MKPGSQLMGCEKCQGLGKGGKIIRLGVIQVEDVRTEMLVNITKEEVIKEGFPDMTPNEFIEMFCKHMKCGRYDTVTRIEFSYIEPCPNEQK